MNMQKGKKENNNKKKVAPENGKLNYEFPGSLTFIMKNILKKIEKVKKKNTMRTSWCTHILRSHISQRDI